jgi:hypothetical protein
MTDDQLIRDHDPFSGHEAPVPAADDGEQEKAPEPPAPKPEAAKKPAVRRAGRKPRRTPSASEVENTRRRALR